MGETRACLYSSGDLLKNPLRPEARLGVQESEPLDSLRTFQLPCPTMGSAAEPHTLTPPLPLPWEQLLLSKHSQCCGKDTKTTTRRTGEPHGHETKKNQETTPPRPPWRTRVPLEAEMFAGLAAWQVMQMCREQRKPLFCRTVGGYFCMQASW